MKFQPFQDRKWNRRFVRALDHNVQRRIFSVWLKRLWSEDGSSLSPRPSNKSIGDKLSLSACEGAQTYLLKPYDSDRILTRQASSTWNGIKANMLHRKFCSLLIDGLITLSIKYNNSSDKFLFWWSGNVLFEHLILRSKTVLLIALNYLWTYLCLDKLYKGCRPKKKPLPSQF